MPDSKESIVYGPSRRTVLRAAAGAALAVATAPVAPLLDGADAEAAEIGAASVGGSYWGFSVQDEVVGSIIIRKGSRSASVTFPGDNTNDVRLDRFSIAILTPRADVGSIRVWYEIDDVRRRFTIKTSTALPGDLAVSFVLVGAISLRWP